MHALLRNRVNLVMGAGTGGARGARAPPQFFQRIKSARFFVMKSALFCDEKCPFCTS
jgi:hypothetical protein